MYSFDIFDTLITRDVATPKGIYVCMQEALKVQNEFPCYIRENFCALRIHAEELARVTYSAKGYEDIGLDKIYEAFELLGCLSKALIEELKELEKQTELAHAVGIAENIEWVKALLTKEEKVVLISDMYLPEAIIRSMLVKADKVFAELPIYVSADWNKTKYSGSLYDLVRERELADETEWIHIGDNSFSDEKQAQKKGIKTELYLEAKMPQWEKEVIEANEFLIDYQYSVGAARLARITSGKGTVKNMDAYRIGTSIGGAVLFPYVYWILQTCRAKKIKRLYFVARDGYILKAIADLLIEAYGLDIKTFYIYGSRKAWRMPAISEDFHDIVRMVDWSHPRNMDSISKLAAVFGLTAEELLPYLPAGCNDEALELNERKIMYLARKLDKDEKFLTFLIEKNMKGRELLKQYLSQEMDLSDADFAFVDLSGGGLTQGCLAQVMREVTSYPVRTFYFRLNRMNLVDNHITYVFIPGRLNGSLIVEMMCRAPHGQTEGYRMKEDGRIEPVLADSGEAEALAAHGYSDFMQGVLDYTKQYRDVTGDLEQGNPIKAVLDYMEQTVTSPQKEVLDFFAGMPNGVTGREKQVIEYAPKLSKAELKDIYLMRCPDEAIEKYYKYSSLEYSLLRCSKEDEEYIGYCKVHYDDEEFKKERLKRRKRAGKKNYGRAERYPVELLEQKIVLYGAGKFGIDLYDKIADYKYSDILLWVDANVKSVEISGKTIAVHCPEDIMKIDFEQVVIAVMYEPVACEIKDYLMALGVPEEKIVWKII